MRPTIPSQVKHIYETFNWLAKVFTLIHQSSRGEISAVEKLELQYCSCEIP
jgi:hypothetical protein